MRLLPLSISDIEKALERARTGNYKHLLFGSSTVETESPTKQVSTFSTVSTSNVVRTSKPVEPFAENLTPYGKWVRDLEHGQKLHMSIKDKYLGGYDSEEDRKKKEDDEKEKRRLEEIEMEKKRKLKIQREFEMAQKVNDERMKEYLQRQKHGQELRRQEEMDKFQKEIANLKSDLERKLGRVWVLDIHKYILTLINRTI